MPNRFLPLGTGADFDQARAVINANFAQLDNEVVTKVFNRANGNAFIEGKLPGDIGYGFLMYDTNGLVAIACYVDSTGQPILKVAKEGFDALTATNDQLIFNSAQNVFKIATTNTATVSVPDPIAAGATVTTPVAHGLGASPAFDVYVNIPSYAGYTGTGQLTKVPGDVIGTVGASGGQIFLRGNARVDATNIYFDVTNHSASSLAGLAGTWTFKYYIQQETAN